jgi:hypothetical protein
MVVRVMDMGDEDAEEYETGCSGRQAPAVCIHCSGLLEAFKDEAVTVIALFITPVCA